MDQNLSGSKDRLYHPESYLRSILANWKVNSKPWANTQRLLSHIEEREFEKVKEFVETHREIGESQGSAFYSLISFAEDFTERYDKHPYARIILGTLQEARLAILGQKTTRDIHLLCRSDDAKATAILVSVNRPEPIVVPIAAGKNLIGRGNSSQPYGLWPKPYAVEQAQWLLQCENGEAQIWDAASTNEGILLPNRVAPAILSENFNFIDLENVDGAILIPHPNRASPKHKYALSDGDVLNSYYASFVFSWL